MTRRTVCNHSCRPQKPPGFVDTDNSTEYIGGCEVFCADTESTTAGTHMTSDPKRLVSGPCWNLNLGCQLFASLPLAVAMMFPVNSSWNHSVFWSVEELECFKDGMW